MARRRRVAVLVDDSPGSMRACRYGAKHLLDKDTDVMLVTAVRDSPDPSTVRRRRPVGNAETSRALFRPSVVGFAFATSETRETRVGV